MKKLDGDRGFSIVEAILILVIVGLLGFIGWVVWSSRATNSNHQDAAKTNQHTAASVSKPQSFTDCKKATGSKILTTYPEQCVTKDGQTFTDPNQSVNQTAKAAADSPTPAAGSCATVTGATVTISLDAGVPNPRCVQVSSNQTLQLNNTSDQSVTATLGSESVVIPAGQSGTIDTPFGAYLQTGDHVIRTGLYGDSGPEIYLPAN